MPAQKKPATKRAKSAPTTSSRRSGLEIKIGIEHSPREITLEVEQTADQLEKALNDAAAKGATLSLTDVKGRRVLLPATKITYIEIGEPTARRVGFGG